MESDGRLRRVEEAIDVLALELLALEELGDRLHLLPGPRRAPLLEAGLVFPILPLPGEIGVGEDVGADIERVAVAVDAYAMELAVPCADWGLEKIDIVVDIDLLPDPVRHFREQIPYAHVALERRGHLENVEVDDAGFDRMLQRG